MSHDIFISYSSHDKAVADAICAALEEPRARIRCWIAPRDVVAGRDFAEEIVNAIEGCRAMVLVFSANANASSHIGNEVSLAFSKGKVIIPLRIEDVRPKGAMEYHLGNKHWIDALTKPREAQIGKLVQTVGVLIERPVGPATPDAVLPGPLIDQRERRSNFLAPIAMAVVAVSIGLGIWLGSRPRPATPPELPATLPGPPAASGPQAPEKEPVQEAPPGSAASRTNPKPGVQTAAPSAQSPSTAADPAFAARDMLLAVFRNLKPASHHDPYTVIIDMDTGAMTMENNQVRWELNLGDLDPTTVRAYVWHPGAGQSHDSTTITAMCRDGRSSIRWGSSDHQSGFSEKGLFKPTMVGELQFQVYEGEGDAYGRDMAAEKKAVDALTALIRYFLRQPL